MVAESISYAILWLAQFNKHECMTVELLSAMATRDFIVGID